MTIQEIKDNLPVLVRVQVSDTLVLTCRVTGRCNDFATVTPVDEGWSHCSWEFSWQAVARVITDNTALKV